MASMPGFSKPQRRNCYDEHGAVIGHHFAGPTWKTGDESEVTGKVTAKVNSPDPNSVPWLLLTATGHSGRGSSKPCNYDSAH